MHVRVAVLATLSVTALVSRAADPNGGNLAGTLSARLYLGDVGTTTLTPTSLVCNFTLTSTTTTTAFSGTSIVSYTAGQQAAIVVTGASVTVGTVSISMAP
jgi:hypothetical protein